MTSKGYGFKLTKTAESDIDETYSYITEILGNPEAASNLADELEEQIERICKIPEIGALVENEYMHRNDVRHVLVKNYIVYYIVDYKDKKIVILRFVYNGRDTNKIVEAL